MCTEVELAWLAGLLEGEGCFGLHTGNRVVVELSMVDEDVVRKAARIMDSTARFHHPPSWQKRGFLPQWRTAVRGKKAMLLMRELLPLMGDRRSSKIISIIAPE